MGRSAIRLTPMMATSGGLMIGVAAMPPSAPRLVTVMVEPVSSSRRRFARPGRLAQAHDFRRQLPEILAFGIMDDRNQQSALRLRGNSHMNRVEAADHALRISNGR